MQRIFPDANVLYSRTLRDWILQLAGDHGTDMFALHWSEDVSAEVIARLRENNPQLSGAALRAIRSHLEGAAWGGLVESYEVTPLPFLKDEKDWHIVAAAQACSAHGIVTNDKGFLDLPDYEKDRLPFEIFHPDAFLMLIHDSAPQWVEEISRRQYDYWSNREEAPLGVDSLSERLVAAGCPSFANVVLSACSRLME